MIRADTVSALAPRDWRCRPGPETVEVPEDLGVLRGVVSGHVRGLGHFEGQAFVDSIRARLEVWPTYEPGVLLTADGSELDEAAARIAARCERWLVEFGSDYSDFADSVSPADWLSREHQYLCVLIDSVVGDSPWRTPCPPPDRDDARREHAKKFLIPALSRLVSVEYWRRELRRESRRVVEAIIRELGYVSAHSGRCVSDHTFGLFLDSRAAIEAWSESHSVLRDDERVAVPVSDLGFRDPERRMAEIYARCRGEERIAQSLGLRSVFVTLTLPPEYHVVHRKSGRFVESFAGLNPRQAHREMVARWALIRSACSREGLPVRGFRVVEAHHDGTPHWHLLLFVEPGRESDIETIIRGYYPGRRAAEFEWIDPELGSASSYVFKYLQKGLNLDSGLDSGSSINDRHSAWFWCWGIRQFQFFGSPSIGVWRELRRIPDTVSDSDVERLRQAAHAGDWFKYAQTLRELGEKTPGVWADPDGESIWFEPRSRVRGLRWVATRGLVGGLVTRRHRWSLVPNSTAARRVKKH